MKTLKWPAWFPYPISWLRAFALAQSFSFVLRRGIPFVSDDIGFLTLLLAAWLIQLPVFFVFHLFAVKILNPLLIMLPGRFRVARKFQRRHTGIRSHLREGLNAVVVIFFAYNLSLLVQLAIFYWPALAIDPVQFLEKLPRQEDVFTERMSILFKRLHVVRVVDPVRNTLIYLTYSDKLIEGSPQNSVTAVPVGRSHPIPVK